MNWAETCAVVIPCRDEESSIGDLVREVRRYLPMVVVVDDCSRDATAARAAEAGALVVRRTNNPGKGAAIKAGVSAALAQQCGWVLTLDGDGQHRPEDIPALLRCAEQTGAALVIGNRMPGAEAMPWLRRMVNRWMSRRISTLAGQQLPDTQCGFRLIKLQAFAALSLESTHFEIESEVLLGFVRSGCRVDFVPIQVVGKGPHSHIHPITDAWRWMQWWRRAREKGQAGAAPASAGWLMRLAKKGMMLLLLGTVFGFGYDWAVPRFYGPERKPGFPLGVLHGALMPVALPSLLLGKDVPIYAERNQGRVYKLGYIAGINLCGMIFFGSAFWSPRKASATTAKGAPPAQ